MQSQLGKSDSIQELIQTASPDAGVIPGLLLDTDGIRISDLLPCAQLPFSSSPGGEGGAGRHRQEIRSLPRPTKLARSSPRITVTFE
jgi:hypothetical protein